jgi:hypothetical protein
MLRRIFVSKRNEIRGGLRKLHNEELHALFSSPKRIRVLSSERAPHINKPAIV